MVNILSVLASIVLLVLVCLFDTPKLVVIIMAINILISDIGDLIRGD